jgi:cation-transporting ATPase E
MSTSTAEKDPAPDLGLSEVEAGRRRANGMGHHVPEATGRTYWQIVRDNLFTFINLTLFGISLLLVVLGLPKEALLSSGIAAINAVIGVVQEAIGKHRLDRIALLTRAKATVVRDGREREIAPEELVIGDLLVLRAGDQVLADGRVLQGRVEVDASLLTGEDDPSPKGAGDTLFAGTYCVAGTARYQADQLGRGTHAADMAAGARAFRLARTPLQRDVNLIVRILLALAGSLLALLLLSSAIWGFPFRDTVLNAAVVVGIVPNGLFLMITVTYTMATLRLVGRDALIQQSNAVESLSNVDVFCLDKTGTLTANRLVLDDLQPVGADETEVRRTLGTIARSVQSGNKTTAALAAACEGAQVPLLDEIPFSSFLQWSALAADVDGLRGVYVLGAPEVLAGFVPGEPVQPPTGWTERGLRVLLLAVSPTPTRLHDAAGAPVLPATLAPRAWLGLADELRPGSAETLAGFRDVGITLKIISGDNPETVAALARQAGFSVDLRLVSGRDLAAMDSATFEQTVSEAMVFGRITPKQKEQIVDALRHRGHYVAMTGDGVNDVLALKKANIGIAMQSGSQATRAVADIVLLHDSFSALPDTFREGQRVRMGLQGVLNLFLTRTGVVFLTLCACAVVQTGFPLSPGHMSLQSLFTTGIPAFGLSLWAHARRTPQSLIRSLAAFVLPAASTLALAAFAVYAAFYLLHDFDLAALRAAGPVPAPITVPLARDALTYVFVLAGVVLVPFACPPIRWFAVIAETDREWRPTLLAMGMLPLYVLVLAVAPLRDFFGAHLLSWTDYLVIGMVVLVWMFVLRGAYRTRAFERYLGIAPEP